MAVAWVLPDSSCSKSLLSLSWLLPPSAPPWLLMFHPWLLQSSPPWNLFIVLLLAIQQPPKPSPIIYFHSTSTPLSSSEVPLCSSPFLCGARSHLPGGGRSVTPQDCFHSPCSLCDLLFPHVWLCHYGQVCLVIILIYVPHLSCILFSVSLSSLVYVYVCLLPSCNGLLLCGLLKIVYRYSSA